MNDENAPPVPIPEGAGQLVLYRTEGGEPGFHAD
jgi:hypothetical protein